MKTAEEILRKINFSFTERGHFEATLGAMEEYAQQSKWVSVDEQKPDCGLYIVSYFNPSDTSKKMYVVPVWRGRDGWYWDNSEKDKAEDSTLKVTHWQPLPTLPNQ